MVTDRPSSGWRQEQKPSSTGEVVNISSSLLSGQTREIRPEQNPPPRTPIKAQQSQDNMMIKSPQVTMAPKPMTPAVNEQPPRAQEVLTSASESPSVKTAAGGEMVAQVEVCKPPSVQLVDKQDSGKVQGFDNGQVRPLSAAGGDQAKVQEDKPMQLDLETGLKKKKLNLMMMMIIPLTWTYCLYENLRIFFFNIVVVLCSYRCTQANCDDEWSSGKTTFIIYKKTNYFMFIIFL